jgi:hypothetical protein
MASGCSRHIGIVMVCVAMATASCGASPKATTVGASPKATTVVYANPVTARGAISLGYVVTAREHGICAYGPTVLESSPLPVYWCGVGRVGYETCWFLKSNQDRRFAAALCQDVPWVRRAVEVVTSSVPATPRGSGTKTNLDWPWAVKLTTGVICMPQPGGGELFQGKGIVDYFCSGSKQALLASANRATALWSFESVRQLSNGGFAVGPVVHVSEAWFAGA